jgi:hypothetical protein
MNLLSNSRSDFEIYSDEDSIDTMKRAILGFRKAHETRQLAKESANDLASVLCLVRGSRVKDSVSKTDVSPDIVQKVFLRGIKELNHASRNEICENLQKIDTEDSLHGLWLQHTGQRLFRGSPLHVLKQVALNPTSFEYDIVSRPSFNSTSESPMEPMDVKFRSLSVIDLGNEPLDYELVALRVKAVGGSPEYSAILTQRIAILSCGELDTDNLSLAVIISTREIEFRKKIERRNMKRSILVFDTKPAPDLKNRERKAKELLDQFSATCPESTCISKPPIITHLNVEKIPSWKSYIVLKDFVMKELAKDEASRFKGVQHGNPLELNAYSIQQYFKGQAWSESM